jgi:hypothetical protein
MPKYEVTMTHRYLVEVNDIREVEKYYDFPDLSNTPATAWVYVDGAVAYEEIGDDEWTPTN